MGFFEENLARLGSLFDSVLDRIAERVFARAGGGSDRRFDFVHDGRAGQALRDFFDRCDSSLARRGIHVSTARAARILCASLLVVLISGIGVAGWMATRVPRLPELTDAEVRATTDLSQRITSRRANTALGAPAPPKVKRPIRPVADVK